MRQDLTYDELLKHARELERKVRHLETKLVDHEKKNEELKTRFLTNISHEIRTPMNAILGFSSLMNDTQLTGEKREEYLEHINQSSAKLLHIVEAMIDVSLIETGQLQIRHEHCTINRLLREIYHSFNTDRHRREQNNIALLLNTDKKAENFSLFTDGYRLEQVLRNLLNNAFKFTEKGIIEFGYQLSEEGKQVIFYVTDSGKGIIKEQLDIIFSSFEKFDFNAAERLDSGVGLGLTLSKGIINLLGGKIWVESNVFNGSTFKFALPYRQSVGEEVGSTAINPFTSKLFIA